MEIVGNVSSPPRLNLPWRAIKMNRFRLICFPIGAVQSFVVAIVISLPCSSQSSLWPSRVDKYSPVLPFRLIDNDDVSHRLFVCPLNMIEIQIDPVEGRLIPRQQ